MQRMTRNKQNAAKTIEPADAAAKIGTVADVAAGLEVVWHDDDCRRTSYARLDGVVLRAGDGVWSVDECNAAGLVGSEIAAGHLRGVDANKRAAVIALASHIREQRLPKKPTVEVFHNVGGTDDRAAVFRCADCFTTYPNGYLNGSKAGALYRGANFDTCPCVNIEVNPVDVAKPAPRAFAVGDRVRATAGVRPGHIGAIMHIDRSGIGVSGGNGSDGCWWFSASDLEHVADERPVIAFEWVDVASGGSYVAADGGRDRFGVTRDGPTCFVPYVNKPDGWGQKTLGVCPTLDEAKRAAEAAYLALSK